MTSLRILLENIRLALIDAEETLGFEIEHDPDDPLKPYSISVIQELVRLATIGKAFEGLVESTHNFHRRFDNIAIGNADHMKKVADEEVQEVVDSLDKAYELHGEFVNSAMESWAERANEYALYAGDDRPSLPDTNFTLNEFQDHAKDTSEEIVDVMVTVVAFLLSYKDGETGEYINMLVNAMNDVADKNNAKTDKTHTVWNGKITNKKKLPEAFYHHSTSDDEDELLF